jgi:putative endopeptidase
VPFFEGMDALLGSIKPAQWRAYLQWHIVHGMADALPARFVDESFQLEKLLSGQPDLRARWKRCVEATDDAMGELLAQPFVKRYFGGNSKTAATQLVLAISKAFAENLDSLAWMDAETRGHARDKLDQMAYLVGYPDAWKPYDFPIDRRGFAANVLAARAFDSKRKLAKIGKPIDRNEWQMSPPTVNAYYSAQQNHMVFPAGILQPPFYDENSAIPVNLGAIGMVVGHELTHGFDDQGSQFDGKGNLDDWWNPATEKKFKAKTSCVVDQATRFEPLPGLHLNGELTLGENIADLGGLKLAFRAYRSLRAQAPETLVADGFTEDQLFFLAHGQIWCAKYRDEALRTLVQTNGHSPPGFRVNGPLSNLPEFAEAFACPVGSAMHPHDACAVW